MKMSESRTQLQHRAAEALRRALTEVSTINLKEIRHDSEVRSSQSTFMAYVDVYGRTHALACEVQMQGQVADPRTTAAALRVRANLVDASATPVLIVPSLSPEIQRACKESRVGFLDLEGNARISLGEVFIVKRVMPARTGEPASSNALSHTTPNPVLTNDPVAMHSMPTPMPPSRSRRSQAPVGHESEIGFAVA